MTREKYIQQLSAESEQSLRYAVGKNIQSILSGSFELHQDWAGIVATSISINLTKHEYLVITNDWSDTQKEAINSFFIEAYIEQTSRDIKTSDERNLESSLLHHQNFSSLLLGESSKLESVSIFEYVEQGFAESVQYDARCFSKDATAKNS